MDAPDELGVEFEKLRPADTRWILVGDVVAVAALLFALLVGTILGDIVAFLLAITAGWVIRSQWQVVTNRSTERTASGRERRS